MKATVMLNDKITLEFDEKSDMDTLQRAISLSDIPQYCHECQKPAHPHLTTNKDKEGNIYIKAVCNGCYAKASLGRYKSGGYFWHKYEKYVPNTPQDSGSREHKPADEEVPF